MEQSIINIDKETMGGTPVFKDTRVPISFLFDYLEDGTMENFLENFPSVKREQAETLLRMASKILTNEKVLQENFA